MNTFLANKLGEVLAFARSGVESLEMGKQGLMTLLSEELIDNAQDELQMLEESVAKVAQEAHDATEVEESATRTQEKIRDMRDRYLDGSWENPGEVLEWMGFSTGAALVHWYVLAGAARAHNNEDLKTVSDKAIQFYTSLFVLDEALLADIGADHSNK
jgi:hypothetical protein